MKLIIALLLACAATAASANPFPEGNAMAGQKLFEQNMIATVATTRSWGAMATIYSPA